MSYRESIVAIGQPVPLHGVATVPDAQPPVATTLLILNSGFLHHVGSCLLSVRIARSAALRGMRSIRMDFSGIGDSPVRPSTGDDEERSASEVCEALAYAQEQWGEQRFVVVGLCSGAYAGFAAARRFDAIDGVIGIAPFGYRTNKWYYHRVVSRLLSLERWRNLAKRMTGRQGATPARYGSEFLEDPENAGWKWPPREQLSAHYQQLTTRGVRFLNVFTGGEHSYYNYEGQMRDMFPEVPFGDQLTELHLPRARHIITEPAYQEQLLEKTASWLDDLSAVAGS